MRLVAPVVRLTNRRGTGGRGKVTSSLSVRTCWRGAFPALPLLLLPLVLAVRELHERTQNREREGGHASGSFEIGAPELLRLVPHELCPLRHSTLLLLAARCRFGELGLECESVLHLAEALSHRGQQLSASELRRVAEPPLPHLIDEVFGNWIRGEHQLYKVRNLEVVLVWRCPHREQTDRIELVDDGTHGRVSRRRSSVVGHPSILVPARMVELDARPKQQRISTGPCPEGAGGGGSRTVTDPAFWDRHQRPPRPGQSLTIKAEGQPGIKRTHAMAAGVADRIWPLTELAALLD